MPNEITHFKDIWKNLWKLPLSKIYNMSYAALTQPPYMSSITKISNQSNFTGFQCIIYKGFW